MDNNVRPMVTHVLKAFPEKELMILALCKSDKSFLELCLDYSKIGIALDAQQSVNSAKAQHLLRLHGMLLKEIDSNL